MNRLVKEGFALQYSLKRLLSYLLLINILFAYIITTTFYEYLLYLENNFKKNGNNLGILGSELYISCRKEFANMSV